MIRVRIEDVHLNKSFVAWSTEERTPQRISLSSQATFERCANGGLITLGVLKDGKAIGTGHIEFCDTVSGENRVVCTNRNGKSVCSLVLFIERKGFIAESAFDLDTLRDQSEVLANRYASHCPSVQTQFNFCIPAAFFTLYARKATKSECDYRDQLLQLVRARYGNVQITPEMYAECLSTYLNFCVDTASISMEDMVEAVYTHLFVPATQMVGIECDPTLVHLSVSGGGETVALALYDNTNHKNYLVDMRKVSPVKLQNNTSSPPGINAFECPTKVYSKVLFQYGKNGMRNVDSDIEPWLNGDFRERFKPFREIDHVVIDKAMSLYAEIPDMKGTVNVLNIGGGTSGKMVQRFYKDGINRFLSGCRTVIVRLERDSEVKEWTEYLVFD